MNALPKLADIDFIGGLALGIFSAFAVLFVMTTTIAGNIA